MRIPENLQGPAVALALGLTALGVIALIKLVAWLT